MVLYRTQCDRKNELYVKMEDIVCVSPVRKLLNTLVSIYL